MLCQEFCVNELVPALETPTGLEPEIELKDRLVRREKFNFNLIYSNISENELFKIHKEAPKKIKTHEESESYINELYKQGVEALLNAEINEHLGYPKHDPSKLSGLRKLLNRYKRIKFYLLSFLSGVLDYQSPEGFH